MPAKRCTAQNGPPHALISSALIGALMSVCTAKQRGMLNFPLNAGAAASVRPRRTRFSTSAVGIMINRATASKRGGSTISRTKVP